MEKLLIQNFSDELKNVRKNPTIIRLSNMRDIRVKIYQFRQRFSLSDIVAETSGEKFISAEELMFFLPIDIVIAFIIKFLYREFSEEYHNVINEYFREDMNIKILDRIQ